MIKISQSLMKDYMDYKNGNYCGLLLKAIYFDKMNRQSSDAQALGNFFEWTILKNMPRDGKEPLADCTQKGEYKEPYRKIVEQAKNWDKIVAHYGIEILEHGVTKETDDEVGTWDFVGRMRGIPKFIGDVKTSGLMDNKWDEMGWDPDGLPFKDKIMTQPVHYKYMSRKLYEKELPFLFFVFDSGKNMDRAIYKVIVDEDKMDEHIRNIQFVKNSIIVDLEIGFIARPTIKSCASCPIKNSCKSFIDVPPITEIYY
jgi:hypothetical protein